MYLQHDVTTQLWCDVTQVLTNYLMTHSCLADVNIQTHFQLEKHIVFLKMAKDLSENTRPKYETKIWKPFDGSVFFTI